jgi:hypothetical protein
MVALSQYLKTLLKKVGDSIFNLKLAGREFEVKLTDFD